MGTYVLRLCAAAARSVMVDGASVALVSGEGARVVLSATDGLATSLEEVHVGLGEGPYIDAVGALAPVLVPDLADQHGRDSRWPFFTREAQALDVHAVFAFPITVRQVSVGSLGMYRHQPGALTTPELGQALETVGDIETTLQDAASWNGSPTGVPSTDGSGRIDQETAQFHQAAGMVMLQLDLTISAAMAVIRARAFSEGVSPSLLAGDLVHRRRSMDGG